MSWLKSSLQSSSPASSPHPWVEKVLVEAEKVVVGKREQILLSLCAFVSEGHVLLEDMPGVGKTTFVKTLARVMGLKVSRIQFTNDLLPADILGSSIFDQGDHRFIFHKGPIFGQVVIADELNRATPRTQSAFLQAMEERRISIDGQTYQLPEPFFVVATQNPQEQVGTYPLPESQLDRFFVRLSMGFPDRQSERQLLKGESRQLLLEQIGPVVSDQEILAAQRASRQIFCSDAVLDYVQNLLVRSRSFASDLGGVSPRGGIALIRAARSWAYLSGRDFVLPDDVQFLASPVLAHRLDIRGSSQRVRGEEIVRQIISEVSAEG